MSAPGSRQTSQAPENLPPGWSYQLDSRTRQYIFFDPNGDSAQIAPTPWIPLVLSTATSATESPSNGATAAARLRRDHGDRIDAARRLRGLAASPPDQGWQPHAAPRPSSDNYDSSQVSPLRARINDLRQRERKPALTWNGITAEPGEPEPHESVQPAKRRKIKIEDGTDNANTDANVANSPLAEPASELFAPPYPGNASNSDVLSPGPVDDNAFLTTEDAAVSRAFRTSLTALWNRIMQSVAGDALSRPDLLLDEVLGIPLHPYSFVEMEMVRSLHGDISVQPRL